MTEDMFGVAGFTSFFIMITAWIAAYRSGRLAYSLSSRQLKGRALRLMVLLGAAGLLVAIKVIGIVTDWPTGYHALETKLVLDLSLLLVPGAAVLTLSVPRLVQLRAAAKGEHQLSGRNKASELSVSLRGQAAEPLLVLPIQAAGWGAAAVFYLTYFASIPLSPSEVVLTPVLTAAIICLFGARQQWRHRSMQAAAWLRPSAARRLLFASTSGIVAAALLTGSLVAASNASRLPDRLDMMSGSMDYGGGIEPAAGAQDHHAHEGSGIISAADLTGPRTGTADKQFTLTASKATVQLDSGASIEAWTFNGGLPGPELRVQQGDLVEIKLVNRDIEEGVTIHMHGVDLPNAEDGVAGVTQDAVMPGQSYTYRFIAEDAGTYWYHSHQETVKGASKGLFGAFIVEPRESQATNSIADIAVIAHTWPTANGVRPIFAFGSADQASTRTIQAGTEVRLRLINADINEKKFRLSGTVFRVTAIDGTDLNKPSELKDQDLLLAAGGRYDVTFIMPDSQVSLTSHSDNESDGGGQFATLTISPTGTSGTVLDLKQSQPMFDPLSYGEAADVPFDPKSTFDRDFTLVLGQKLGFYDGSFAYALTINGKLFPNTPMLMVREGDLVRTTFINHSSSHHPMHLHGHHMLVLSRNGVPSTGSSWWTDTLDVAPGDVYTVAFRADNPGVWMDHCHNLNHAAVGMMLHLAYEGVTTPFTMGRGTVNHPE